jgi:molecular chaperone DnaK
VPQVEVTFDIDCDGILQVSAKDLHTSQQQQFRVSAGGGLSKDQVKNLVDDAQTHAEEDAVRRELADLRNTGEGLVYSVEQTLAEYGEHLESSEQEEVRAAVARARKACSGQDAGELRDAVEDLQQLAYRMTEAVFERIQAASTDAEPDSEA